MAAQTGTQFVTVQKLIALVFALNFVDFALRGKFAQNPSC